MESSGKSSLINALRGLKPRDALGVRVGRGYTLSIPSKHVVSGDDGRFLWELPAVRSVTPEYVDRVQLGQYDAVFLCCTSILTDYDLDLARVCRDKGIPCTVVRTSIDLALEADIDDYGDQHNASNLLGLVKTEHRSQLKANNLTHEIYIISNKHPSKWDFQSVLGLFRAFSIRPIKEAIRTAPIKKPKPEIASAYDSISTIYKSKTNALDRTYQNKKGILDEKKSRFMYEMDSDMANNIGQLERIVDKYKTSFGVSHANLRDIYSELYTLEAETTIARQERNWFIETLYAIVQWFASWFGRGTPKTTKPDYMLKSGSDEILRIALDRCHSAAMEQLGN